MRLKSQLSLVSCHLSVVTCPRKQPGFTLIELLVVMALFALMIGFTSINLLKPQTKASLDTTVTTLVADLKQQQIQAMAGENASAFGVYLESTKYTLFRGSSPGDNPASNFAVNLDQGLNINTTATIVFAQRSGETGTINFIVGNNTSGESKIININSLGAVTIQ